ncbi:FAD-binding oxidoreductase [Phytohabitans suffuscus]|uniref:Putative FAD-linked oxidoreductase YgaK n=1 Tax=Phytohabitans suffuscus TaxID=624315 RepID=A0A6F8YAS6_9ACTN|nr:FAD-binding oxidoreductase [Phytohabitans suffuscus]BCB83205.1 putative FAD-linked oxidoreductase YgaK [Phytohabitans suffuscus]
MSTAPVFGGRIVTRLDPSYEEARQVWNAVPDHRPLEIRYCRDAQDVAAALRDALARGLPFAARSGGHSAAALSVVPDGVVIDVSPLNSISLDQDASQVTFGSGATLGAIYRTLWESGVTVPAGTCPNIGVAGHVLGGGLGILSRSRGPLVDHLIGVTMVDARGELVTADEENHSDLLWACRGGGGGNYGIATSFTLRTQPIADVTLFNITWRFDDLGPAVKAWQSWLADADHRINPFMMLYPREQDMVATVGVMEGTPDAFEPLVKPLLDAVEPSEVVIEPMSFIQAVDTVEALQGEAAVAKSVRALGSSAIIDRPLDDRALETLRRHLIDPPSHRSEVAIYGMGGKIAAKGREETAFVHRTELMAFEYRTDWDEPADDEKNVAWVRSVRQEMAEHTTGGTYTNTVDLGVENWLWGYYEENLPRLMGVKHRYDPDGVFQHAHSVPLSLTEAEASRFGIPEQIRRTLRAAGRLT